MVAYIVKGRGGWLGGFSIVFRPLNPGNYTRTADNLTLEEAEKYLREEGYRKCGGRRDPYQPPNTRSKWSLPKGERSSHGYNPTGREKKHEE